MALQEREMKSMYFIGMLCLAVCVIDNLDDVMKMELLYCEDDTDVLTNYCLLRSFLAITGRRRTSGPHARNPKGLHQDLPRPVGKLRSLQGTN